MALGPLLSKMRVTRRQHWDTMAVNLITKAVTTSLTEVLGKGPEQEGKIKMAWFNKWIYILNFLFNIFGPWVTDTVKSKTVDEEG